jgi:hypothetical protein
MPLDCVMDCPVEPGWRQLPFYQVVVCSRMSCFQGNYVVIGFPADYDRRTRRHRVQQGDVSQSRTVGHIQIEQYDVERAATRELQGGKKFRAPADFSRKISALPKHLLHVAGEAGVALNYQHFE